MTPLWEKILNTVQTQKASFFFIEAPSYSGKTYFTQALFQGLILKKFSEYFHVSKSKNIILRVILADNFHNLLKSKKNEKQFISLYNHIEPENQKFIALSHLQLSTFSLNLPDTHSRLQNFVTLKLPQPDDASISILINNILFKKFNIHLPKNIYHHATQSIPKNYQSIHQYAQKVAEDIQNNPKRFSLERHKKILKNLNQSIPD